jgi:dolichyl-phosphate-mannose-protein mannosyltransferase
VAWLALLMFAMSAAVTVRQPVWSPLDEGPHWATADMFLHGVTPLIDGRYVFPPDLPGGVIGVNYQAAEPPLTYFVLAGVESLAQGLARAANATLGTHRSPNRVAVHAERLFNSLLLASLVPLLWLAARLIAPGNLAFAWGMPGALFFFRGVLIDGSRVSNDVLVAVLATLAVYLVLRGGRALHPAHGLLVGFVIGLSTLAKYQGAFAFLPIGLLLLVRLPGGGLDRFWRSALYLAGAVLVWALLIAPWFYIQYQRYGDATGGAAERRVLPPEALLAPDPWPQIFDSPHHVFLSATFAEVANPLNVHFAAANILIAQALPWLLVVGALALPLAATVAGGLTRLERVALGVTAPLMFVLLAAISLNARIIVVWDARDQLPAALPFTLLVAAPLLFSRPPVDRALAAAAMLAVSALAIFSAYLLSLPW